MKPVDRHQKIMEAAAVGEYVLTLLQQYVSDLTHGRQISRVLNGLFKLGVCLAYELVYSAGGNKHDAQLLIDGLPDEYKSYPPLHVVGTEETSMAAPGIRAAIQKELDPPK